MIATTVPTHELRLGDEVQGYGEILFIGTEMNLMIPVSRKEEPNFADIDLWPRNAMIPLMRRRRQWSRTIRFVSNEESYLDFDVPVPTGVKVVEDWID